MASVASAAAAPDSNGDVPWPRHGDEQSSPAWQQTSGWRLGFRVAKKPIHIDCCPAGLVVVEGRRGHQEGSSPSLRAPLPHRGRHLTNHKLPRVTRRRKLPESQTVLSGWRDGRLLGESMSPSPRPCAPQHTVTRHPDHTPCGSASSLRLSRPSSVEKPLPLDIRHEAPSDLNPPSPPPSEFREPVALTLGTIPRSSRESRPSRPCPCVG
ncbi:hypothetical protein QBC39DRAFT_145352 [Podospora conica]|nr:hypothetical protein QBC39DRAFT_145352 [Schizothecium conicum]